MSIEIKPSELESIDQIGDLDGEQVKLVKTKGGLYIAVGKPKGKRKEEVLAAGSHPAIVKYNIEKSFTSFQPSLMKSELGGDSSVVNVSELLPNKMTDQGYDLYIVKKSNEIDFILTKSQIETLKYSGAFINSDLVISKTDKMITSDLVPAVSAISLAAAAVAIEEEKTGIVYENSRFTPESVLNKK